MNTFKPILLILIFALVASIIGAQENNGAITSEDIFTMVPSLEGKMLSEVTTDELLVLAEELSVRKQEERYVQPATISSLCFPGVGEFITGKAGLGLVQSGFRLGIIAGSLTGAYLLLPETVKQTMNTRRRYNRP